MAERDGSQRCSATACSFCRGEDGLELRLLDSLQLAALRPRRLRLRPIISLSVALRSLFVRHGHLRTGSPYDRKSRDLAKARKKGGEVLSTSTRGWTGVGQSLSQGIGK